MPPRKAGGSNKPNSKGKGKASTSSLPVTSAVPDPATDKGSADASEPSPSELPTSTTESVSTEVSRPKFKSLPGAKVIQYFSEPDGAPSRGYLQDRFDSALRDVYRLREEAIERNKATKENKEAEAKKLQEYSEALSRIVAELEVSKEIAGRALLKHDGNLKQALSELIHPIRS